MSDYGLRRRFRSVEVCPRCGDKRLKKYVRHPFALPPGYEKGGNGFSPIAPVLKKAAPRIVRGAMGF